MRKQSSHNQNLGNGRSKMKLTRLKDPLIINSIYKVNASFYIVLVNCYTNTFTSGK